MSRSMRKQDDAWFPPNQNDASKDCDSSNDDEALARQLELQLSTAEYVKAKQQESADEKLAKMLADEEEKQHKLRAPSPPEARSSKLPNEDEDAALARAIWEEEQAAQPKPRGDELVDNSVCYRCKISFAQRYSGRTITALGRTYHQDCFLCVACSGVINDTTFASDEDRNPIHTSCYQQLYMPSCVVCKDSIANSNNAVNLGGRMNRLIGGRSNSQSYSYSCHPFFSDWKYCTKHENKSKRCTSCSRVEPNDAPFNDLNDSGRKVCMSCVRSVVLDNDELKPIFDEALTFLSEGLGICVFPEMHSIPVMSVGSEILNERGRSGGQCRGLCLSESCSSGFRVPVIRRRGIHGFVVEEEAFRFDHTERSVTAILILSGLPRTLTTSIVVHECIHAWLKLHPNFNKKGIDKQSEEGICQLAAHLFLEDVIKKKKRDSGRGRGEEERPTNLELSEYFRFSIEKDVSPVYGDGFRKAKRCYDLLGSMEVLLDLVNTDGSLPQM